MKKEYGCILRMSPLIPPKISTSDALRAIMADRGRPPLEDPFCEADVRVAMWLTLANMSDAWDYTRNAFRS